MSNFAQIPADYRRYTIDPFEFNDRGTVPQPLITHCFIVTSIEFMIYHFPGLEGLGACWSDHVYDSDGPES